MVSSKRTKARLREAGKKLPEESYIYIYIKGENDITSRIDYCSLNHLKTLPPSPCRSIPTPTPTRRLKIPAPNYRISCHLYSYCYHGHQYLLSFPISFFSSFLLPSFLTDYYTLQVVQPVLAVYYVQDRLVLFHHYIFYDGDDDYYYCDDHDYLSARAAAKKGGKNGVSAGEKWS